MYDSPNNTSTGQGRDDRPLSERVVQAVADRKSVDVVELHPPLYDAVDPQSLDSLFEDRDVGGTVSFHWHGYVITVSADGSVIVDEPVRRPRR